MHNALICIMMHMKEEGMMISQAQKTRLEVLARDVGYRVRVSPSQIEVKDDHGGYTFENSDVSYNAAIAFLKQLKERTRGDQK